MKSCLLIERMLLIIIAVLLFSCTPEEVKDRECNLSSLQGEWDWKETLIGVSGSVLTPENTGWNKRLVITDSVWSEYNRDSLLFTSGYTFTPDTNSSSLQGSVLFTQPPGNFIHVYNCTMTIEGGFDDSPVNTYEFVK